jgi:hypothetical protein
VTVCGKLRLVVRLQQQADHLLQQLVRPDGQSQRPLAFRSLLVDVDATGWGPSIAFGTERFDDRRDLAQVHAVGCLVGDAGCHGTGVAVDLAVGQQEQPGVEQASVEPLQWQSSSAAFADDVQHGFGVSHLAYLTIPVDR